MKKMLLGLLFFLSIAGCSTPNRMSESEVLAFVAEMRTLTCTDLALRKSEYRALWTAGVQNGANRSIIADREFDSRCKK
jgi:hypothetical protein